jgi:hypothetical protein
VEVVDKPASSQVLMIDIHAENSYKVDVDNSLPMLMVLGKPES